MLFTEEELCSINPLDILDECMYLGYDESLIDPRTVPVTENSRLGYNIVRFDDVDALAESYGIDYIDAMYSIAENNNIDPDDLAVSVPEEDIIAYPELVNELANIVIEPLSEDSLAYGYVTACLEAYNNTGEEDFLWGIVEDTYIDDYVCMLLEEDQNQNNNDPTQPSLWARTKGWFGNALGSSGRESDYNIAKAFKQFKGKGRLTSDNLKTLGMDTEYNQAMSNVGKGSGILDSRFDRVTRNRMAVGVGAAAVAGGLAAAYKMVKSARNKPKSWIGQKIAALRNVYTKWMQQAQNSKNAGVFKSAAAKLLSIIDQLMAMMQRAAG